MEEVDAYMTWCQEREIAPLITGLRHKMKQVADAELERALGTLGQLDAGHREAITQAVHRITGKLLHEPTVRLKSPEAAARGYHHAVRHLFALTEPEPAALECARGRL
jgi:glutamyl-tRNA reductase